METLKVKFRRMRPSGDLPAPGYQTESASGVDLLADIEGELTLKPLERAAIPTGLAVEIPRGFEGQVRPRSGLSLRYGVTCLNSPGTIDADYRGEVKVVLANLSNEPYTVRRGDRIAQLVFAPVARASLVEVESLSPTERGHRGFGSTGR